MAISNHERVGKAMELLKAGFGPFVALVGRGSPDPARVPDRRSPSSGVCFESTNSFEARAYDDRRRPSVGHSGGVGRPAPNTRETFGRALRRGRETRAEHQTHSGGVGRPAPN